MDKSQKVLIAGGALSIMIAILHIVIIIGGASWYRFFGAGEEMAVMAEQGSWIPGLVTSGITIVFFVWGLYAFSGAGAIKMRLPFKKLALVLISAIYLIRGLGTIPALAPIPDFSAINGFMFWSSFISLCIGSFYALGLIQRWAKI